MKVYQESITLKARSRGFHLIDSEIESALPQLKEIKMGTIHLFLKHTSASICLGENVEREVRDDLENFFNDIVGEDKPYFTHTYEGKDDMPAHIKSIMIGVSLSLPITDGRLNLGMWQGIYLNEHREFASGRELVMTIQGV